jgi:hypothetical protein
VSAIDCALIDIVGRFGFHNIGCDPVEGRDPVGMFLESSFGGFPLGDITNNAGEQVFVVDGILAEADFDGELLSIGVLASQFDPIPVDGAVPFLEVSGEAVPMSIFEGVRHQDSQRLANEILGRVSEQVFDGIVRIPNRTRVVDCDDPE